MAMGQAVRGSFEVPDAYEWGEPFVFKPKYEHDPRNRKMITNPDFFCSQCAKERRIPFKTRNEMKDVLETKREYPIEFQGKKFDIRGQYRLIEHDAGQVLEYVFKKMKTKNPVFIEDKYFRGIVDFEGFDTKMEVYPRREIELEQLGDIFPEVTKKTVDLNYHQRAHLYLIRAHRVMRDFSNWIDYNPKAEYLTYLGPYHGMKEKFEFFIFDDKKLLGEFIVAFLGHNPILDGECWHTLQDDNMSALMHCENIPDVHLNNGFTHRMAFNFLQGFRGYQWNNPAWLQLGYGHLMERRERTDFNTFILGEGRIPDLWGNTKWKPAIRKWVEKGTKIRPFAEIATFEDVGQITPEEHGICWSMVSYLMQLDAKKFAKFYHIIKDKKQGESIFNLQVRAFHSAFGITPTKFFEDWQEWVLRTYPAM